MSSPIERERSDGVDVITINRPDAMNSLSPTLDGGEVACFLHATGPKLGGAPLATMASASVPS